MVSAYASPARGYHNVEHLREVLERIDEIVAVHPLGLADLEVIRLAAFFHDVVYRTEPGGAVSNEEASAQWAYAALGGHRPEAQARRVADLVRSTYDHRAASGDEAAAVLLDADLAILAAPPQRYARYVTGVRYEYSWLPEQDFRAGRAALLTDLLDREFLFATRYGRDHWEAQARANVRSELADRDAVDRDDLPSRGHP